MPFGHGVCTFSSSLLFHLKRVILLTTFTILDIQIENCAICRNHLMEPCIECQPNSLANGGEECIAAWGMCNHAFHLHCIKKQYIILQEDYKRKKRQGCWTNKSGLSWTDILPNTKNLTENRNQNKKS